MRDSRGPPKPVDGRQTSVRKKDITISFAAIGKCSLCVNSFYLITRAHFTSLSTKLASSRANNICGRSILILLQKRERPPVTILRVM